MKEETFVVKPIQWNSIFLLSSCRFHGCSVLFKLLKKSQKKSTFEAFNELLPHEIFYGPQRI